MGGLSLLVIDRKYRKFEIYQFMSGMYQYLNDLFLSGLAVAPSELMHS